MIALAHVIAVKRTPAEIREITVPSAQAPAKIAELERSFETVFIHRRFMGYPPREGGRG